MLFSGCVLSGLMWLFVIGCFEFIRLLFWFGLLLLGGVWLGLDVLCGFGWWLVVLLGMCLLWVCLVCALVLGGCC